MLTIFVVFAQIYVSTIFTFRAHFVGSVKQVWLKYLLRPSMRGLQVAQSWKGWVNIVLGHSMNSQIFCWPVDIFLGHSMNSPIICWPVDIFRPQHE